MKGIFGPETSYALSGLALRRGEYPRLSPWALFLRRFAAAANYAFGLKSFGLQHYVEIFGMQRPHHGIFAHQIILKYQLRQRFFQGE
jgi:hypothetical protein